MSGVTSTGSCAGADRIFPHHPAILCCGLAGIRPSAERRRRRRVGDVFCPFSSLGRRKGTCRPFCANGDMMPHRVPDEVINKGSISFFFFFFEPYCPHNGVCLGSRPGAIVHIPPHEGGKAIWKNILRYR